MTCPVGRYDLVAFQALERLYRLFVQVRSDSARVRQDTDSSHTLIKLELGTRIPSNRYINTTLYEGVAGVGQSKSKDLGMNA